MVQKKSQVYSFQFWWFFLNSINHKIILSNCQMSITHEQLTIYSSYIWLQGLSWLSSSSYGSLQFTIMVCATSCEFESCSGEVYLIQHYVIKFVRDLRQVCGFLWVLWFPPPIKLTHHIISYIGFRQVIRAHITCLCFIFPEPKAREIYSSDSSDRLYNEFVILQYHGSILPV